MLSRSLPCLGPHGFHTLNYYEWGDANNPRVLICVHGLTRNGRDFDDLAKALSGDYRVLCPDVAGRGQSKWLPYKEDYGYPLYLADMAALIARSGAEQVVASVHQNPLNKTRWITEFLGAGDIDRVIIEWRSLLRQIGKAPSLDWPRWTALQELAREILNETQSPTLTELPPLDYAQTKRIEHRLTFRRH